MRVCIFISSLDKKSGGPSRSVPILVKGLAELGCDVTLLFLESEDMNTHILDNTKAKIEILPYNYTKYDLETVILKGNYDIVHSQGIWVPIYNTVAKILRKHGIPYIMTPRGALEPWCLSQKKIKKRIAMMLYQRRDLQQAAAILTTAEMEAQHIRELGISTPLAVIPNGIDVTEYECRSSDFYDCVKKQILFLSRIHPKKGIEVLINVIEKLCWDYPDWKVVIAGNGEDSYIAELSNLIDSKGLAKVIKIIPPVFGEEKQKLYSESSLFVLPTYSENFGMVIAEALSCGVPVVTTNGTPWKELNAEKIGWCVELSEPNIERAIRNALSMHPRDLYEMGQRGSIYIRNNYLYTSVARKNLELYNWIIRKEEKPEFLYD